MRLTARCFFAAIGMVPIALAAPAAGQEIGSLIDRDRGQVGYLENVDSANSAQVIVTFARCFARQRERAAEAVLALPYMSAAQDAEARQMIGRYESCLGDNAVQLRFPPQLLIGGMAEHFVARRYERVDISRLTTMTDEALADAAFAGRNAYEALSLCTIRRDPAAARALIATVPRSQEERAAIQRITPHLAPCIPADFQMTFSRGALRALIAIGVYRIVVALDPAGS